MSGTQQSPLPPPRHLLSAEDIGLDIPFFQAGQLKTSLNPARILSSLYFNKARKNYATILDGIHLSLYSGDRIGLIGHNGAGKSSLLRVLAQVYPLTRGQLKINGSVKGLFHISLGMNQEGNGIENIYLRGMQMGLTMDHIRELVPEVIAFSELEDHIHKPIATYSTGMMLRLAFAISTMIQPDILLLDEWIGAGDTVFKDKAEKRMNDIVTHSNGLVIATHNDNLMKRVCNKGLVMFKGRAVFSGDIDDCLKFYHSDYKGLSAQ